MVSWANAAGAAEWRLALPGCQYVFPRDHGPHPEFKTEWLYFTGNLRDAKGRRFGYELTLFRQGIRPGSGGDSGGNSGGSGEAAAVRPPTSDLGPSGGSGESASVRPPTSDLRPPVLSRFVVNDLKFAHFALSDVAGQKFHFHQNLSRGAFGEAGFGLEGGRLAWIDGWTIELAADGRFHLQAQADGFALDLMLKSAKPWVIHGVDGVSQKAVGEGHASHYYSGSRMRSDGELRVDGHRFEVAGESWFDHEWATNQLAPDQLGWNWFSIQLGDGTELMLYQMRRRDGSIDPASSGTIVTADGATSHLGRDDYELTPDKFWISKSTGARYPLEWQVRVPSLAVELTVTTPLQNQELVFPSIAYWEGLIDVAGTRAGQPVSGHGYMELTGYAGALTGLGK